MNQPPKDSNKFYNNFGWVELILVLTIVIFGPPLMIVWLHINKVFVHWLLG